MSINHQATPPLLLSEVFVQVVKVEGIVKWEHLTLWCHYENVYGALDKEPWTWSGLSNRVSVVLIILNFHDSEILMVSMAARPISMIHSYF